jgi:5-methylcytosine-specific restriction endonuclease McrA
LWNDLDKLHIDHIVPISVHNFEKVTDDDFKKCWALNNLQLLPSIENISKGAKLEKHFQPSLIFGDTGG